MKIIKVKFKEICDEIGISVPNEFSHLSDSVIKGVKCAAKDVEKGDLFFSFDNEYLENPVDKEEEAKHALSKGALAVFSSKALNCKYIKVDDCTKAFSKASYCYRRLFKAKAVCVTGSIGKTSETLMVSHVLKNKYSTFSSSEFNYNDLRLTARCIRMLKSGNEFYVQETMEGPPAGYPSLLSGMIHPDAAIITRVSDSHIDHMKSKENVAKSCLGIEDFMTDDGVVFLNADDPYQTSLKPKHRTITYGVGSNADYRAEDIRYDIDGRLTMNICYGNKKTGITVNCVGKHNAYNVASSFALAKWAGMTDDEIKKAFESYESTGIRQNIVHEKGQTLYIDCFNASSDSVRTAIETLDELQPKGNGERRMVFGFLSEIDSQLKEVHTYIGKIIADSKIKTVFCFGESTKFTAEVCKAAGKQVFFTADRNELNKAVEENTRENDIILFKGSRMSMLEATVEAVYGLHLVNQNTAIHTDIHYTSSNDVGMFYIADHAVVCAKEAEQTNLTIPDKVEDVFVTGVLEHVYAYDKSVKTVNLPSHLKYINNSAFTGTDIEELTLPPDLLRVETYAFCGCKKLKNVVFNDKIYHIGDKCFSNCDLREIMLPDSLTYIGKDAFYGCHSLKIKCAENSLAHKYAAKNGIPFELLNGKNVAKRVVEDIPRPSYPARAVPPSLKSKIKGTIKKIAKKIGLR